MIFFSGVAGFFLVLAVFLQTGFGCLPLQSGLTTVPFPLGVLIASLVSGRLGQPLAAPADRRRRADAGRRHGGAALSSWAASVRPSITGLRAAAAACRASAWASAYRRCSRRCWPTCRRAMRVPVPARCSRSSRSAARSASRSPARYSFPALGGELASGQARTPCLRQQHVWSALIYEVAGIRRRGRRPRVLPARQPAQRQESGHRRCRSRPGSGRDLSQSPAQAGDCGCRAFGLQGGGFAPQPLPDMSRNGPLDPDHHRCRVFAERALGAAKAPQGRDGHDRRDLRPFRLRFSVLAGFVYDPQSLRRLSDPGGQCALFDMGGRRRPQPDLRDRAAHPSLLVPQLCGRHRLFAHRAGAGRRVRPAVPGRDGDARRASRRSASASSASC